MIIDIIASSTFGLIFSFKSTKSANVICVIPTRREISTFMYLSVCSRLKRILRCVLLVVSLDIIGNTVALNSCHRDILSTTSSNERLLQEERSDENWVYALNASLVDLNFAFVVSFPQDASMIIHKPTIILVIVLWTSHKYDSPKQDAIKLVAFRKLFLLLIMRFIYYIHLVLNSFAIQMYI